MDRIRNATTSTLLNNNLNLLLFLQCKMTFSANYNSLLNQLKMKFALQTLILKSYIFPQLFVDRLGKQVVVEQISSWKKFAYTTFSQVGPNCKSTNPCADGKICFDICDCPGYQCIGK